MAEHTCAKCMEGRHVRCQAKGRCPCPTCGGNRRSRSTGVQTRDGWSVGKSQVRPARPRTPSPRRTPHPRPKPLRSTPREPSVIDRTGKGGPQPMTDDEEAAIREAVLQLVEGIARRSGRAHLIERTPL